MRGARAYPWGSLAASQIGPGPKSLASEEASYISRILVMLRLQTHDMQILDSASLRSG
jgi:hypothetical protein